MLSLRCGESVSSFPICRVPRPLKRRELIRLLRDHGFEGPFPGARHQFMMKGERKVWIPNPHKGDIGVPLLREIFRQAGIPPPS